MKRGNHGWFDNNKSLYEERMEELKQLNQALDEKIELNAILHKFESESTNEASIEGKRHHGKQAKKCSTAASTDEELIRLVLQPGESFVPDEVSHDHLQDGHQATVYKQTRQKVHKKVPEVLDYRSNYSTNPLEESRSAEDTIERFNEETEKMREDLGTLDDFIRKNKSLFPPNLVVLQRFVYHKPSPLSLLDSLDAQYDDLVSPMELVSRVAFHDKPCRVKVKETLVIPKGTDLKGYDVEGVLERCYHRMEDVEVVYEDAEGMKKKLQEQKEKQDEEVRQGRLDDEASFRLKLNDNYTKIDNENDTINIFSKNKQMLAEYNFPKKEGESLENNTTAPNDHASLTKPPSFLTQLLNQHVIEGHDVTLTCALQDHTEVKWYRDGELLKEGDRLVMKVSRKQTCFTFHSNVWFFNKKLFV